MLAHQSCNFCPNCGKNLGQEQIAGRVIKCLHCGKEIGKLEVAPQIATSGPVVNQKQLIDRRDEPIKQGLAAQCRFCGQVVQTKGAGPAKAFVPHFEKGSRKMCKSSGRRVED